MFLNDIPISVFDTPKQMMDFMKYYTKLEKEKRRNYNLLCAECEKRVKENEVFYFKVSVLFDDHGKEQGRICYILCRKCEIMLFGKESADKSLSIRLDSVKKEGGLFNI